MADAKKEEAPWPFKYESKFKYNAADSIEKHLDSFIDYSKADVQREVMNLNLMLSDMLYDSAKAAMSDAKTFKGATKHGKFPQVVHLKGYKGTERRSKAHAIIEQIVKAGAAESYREHGKELDAKKADEHVKKILSDHTLLDKHLQAYAGIGYHDLVDALIKSDNILAGLKGQGRLPHDQQLAKFLDTYVSNLNRLAQAHEHRSEHIQRSYNDADMKKIINSYTEKKAAEMGLQIAPTAGLNKRFNILQKASAKNSLAELEPGESEITPAPPKKK